MSLLISILHLARREAYLVKRIAHVVLRIPDHGSSDSLRYTHHEGQILGFVLFFYFCILHSAFCISSSLPSAMEILAQVRSNFPQETLLIKGQILSGGRIGKLERACYIETLLDLGEDPATVRYKISDAFGTPFEQMTISIADGCEAEFEYENGNPLQPAAAPPPTQVIMDTDVTWNDLSLLFLWRTDGRTTREESLRGRDCYVIEFPGNDGVSIGNSPPKAGPPLTEKSPAEGGSASGGKIENLQFVWIDMQMLMLIQMEDIGREGALQRRMTVKNIKKISDQWMIKNMEIRRYPSLHHTLIRIDEVMVLP